MSTIMAVGAAYTIKGICMLTVFILTMVVSTSAEITTTQYARDYAFRYHVDAAPVKGAVTDRWEERRGDVVRGAYSLLQPDGMIRSVDYESLRAAASSKTAVEREGGLRAVVRYWPGPQNLLSSMSLSDSLAEHAHPPINAKALWGKDYDEKQPERIKKSVEMYASLRAELNANKLKLPALTAQPQTS